MICESGGSAAYRMDGDTSPKSALSKSGAGGSAPDCAPARLRYRLKQDGIVVAWTEGPTALAEIAHYALVYGQDGPVLVEQHIGGKWRALKRTSPTHADRAVAL